MFDGVFNGFDFFNRKNNLYSRLPYVYLMKKAHSDILEQLKRRPMSKYELADMTGYSLDGLRGRISEMRKLGYDIQLVEVTETKYELVKAIKSCKEKLVEYLEKVNAFDKVIDIHIVAKNIHMSVDEVTQSISELFDDYTVVQMSNTKVIIKRL